MGKYENHSCAVFYTLNDADSWPLLPGHTFVQFFLCELTITFTFVSANQIITIDVM